MSVQTLPIVPQTFIAGQTIIVGNSFTNYPSNGGWSMILYLSKQASNVAPVAIASVADASGIGFTTTISQAVSAVLAAGVYDWSFVVSDGAQSEVPFCGGRGTTYITPNPAIATTPSIAQQMLIALNESMLFLASGTEFTSTNFNGQSYTRADIYKLREMQVALQAEVLREQQNIDRLRGGRDPGRILTRFAPSGWCGPWGYNGGVPYQGGCC